MSHKYSYRGDKDKDNVVNVKGTSRAQGLWKAISLATEDTKSPKQFPVAPAINSRAAPKGSTGPVPIALQKKLDSQQGVKSGSVVTTYEDLDKIIAEEYVNNLKQQLYFLELEHSQLKASSLCTKCGGGITMRGVNGNQTLSEPFAESYGRVLEEKMKAEEVASELEQELGTVRSDLQELQSVRKNQQRLEHDLAEANALVKELQGSLKTQQAEEKKGAMLAIEESSLSVDVATLYSLQERITQLEVDKCIQESQNRKLTMLKQQADASKLIADDFLNKILQEHSSSKEESVRLREELRQIQLMQTLHETAGNKWSTKIIDLQNEVNALRAQGTDTKVLEQRDADIAHLKMKVRLAASEVQQKDEALRTEARKAANAELAREQKLDALRRSLAAKEAHAQELTLRLSEMEARVAKETSETAASAANTIAELTKQLADKTHEAHRLQESLRVLMQNLHG